MAFETYVPQRGPSVGRSTIRILKNGNFSISPAAYEKWFRKSNYVELLFDARTRKVGLRPRGKPTKASYKLRTSPQGGDTGDTSQDRSFWSRTGLRCGRPEASKRSGTTDKGWSSFR